MISTRVALLLFLTLPTKVICQDTSLTIVNFQPDGFLLDIERYQPLYFPLIQQDYLGINLTATDPDFTDTINTNILYSTGQRGYERFHINHRQRISDSAQFYLGYSKLNFVDDIPNSSFASGWFNGGFTVNKRLWSAEMGFQAVSQEKEVNGTILDDSLLIGSNARSLVPVSNNEGTRTGQLYNFSGEVSYSISPKCSLFIKGHGKRYDHTFSDSDLSDSLYSELSIFQDSSATEDFYREGYEVYTLGLERRLKKSNLSIGAGVINSYYRNSGFKFDYNPAAQLSHSLSGDLILETEVLLSMGDNLSYMIQSAASYTLSGGQELGAYLYSSSRHSISFSDEYSSNHLRWDQDPSYNRSLILNISFKDTTAKINVTTKYINYQNSAYISDSSIITGDINFIQFQAKKTIDLSDWRINLSYSPIFNLAGRELNYPMHSGTVSIGRTLSFFKNKLRSYTHISAIGHNSYTVPSLNSFVPILEESNNKGTANVYCNVGIRAKIGDLLFGFQYWNVGSGLTYQYSMFSNSVVDPGRFFSLSFGLQFND